MSCSCCMLPVCSAHDWPQLCRGNEAEELAEQSRFWAQNTVPVRIAREKLRYSLALCPCRFFVQSCDGMRDALTEVRHT